MIKKLIGAIVALAILAIIVFAILGHTKYKSMIAQSVTIESATR